MNGMLLFNPNLEKNLSTTYKLATINYPLRQCSIPTLLRPFEK